MTRATRREGVYETRLFTDRWLLRLIRVRHYFFGPWMGCSCSRCFESKHRLVHGPEVIQMNLRAASLEERIRVLERKCGHD